MSGSDRSFPARGLAPYSGRWRNPRKSPKTPRNRRGPRRRGRTAGDAGRARRSAQSGDQQGHRGLGFRHRPGSDLQPPPDNSWDRARGFFRRATRRANRQAQKGFDEAPQRDYTASPVTGLDPAAGARTGLGDEDERLISSPPPCGERSAGEGDAEGASATTRSYPPPQPSPTRGRGQSRPACRGEEKTPKYRLPRADLPTQAGGVAGFGGMASQQSLDRLLREGRAGISAQPAAAIGRRTGRRGRKNPKAAAARRSRPSSSRKATSRRRSRNWSKASSARTARRCCSASPARARPSPWPR